MGKETKFEDLQSDRVMGAIIEKLSRRLGGQVPDSVKESLVDIVKWADVVPKQVRQWLDDTVGVVSRILSGTANSSDYSICWIRIFEIIHHLPDYFEKSECFYEERDKLTDVGMKRHLELGHEIRGHLAKLEETLSEEERITLEYERNCNAHIFQAGYRVQVKITGDDKVTKAKLDYRGKPLKEVHEIIQRVLKQYGGKDANFLGAILRKIQPHLAAISPLLPGWSK